MVSLVDHTTQYFLAGVCRKENTADPIDVRTDHRWFGCSTVETPAGLCEVCTPDFDGASGLEALRQRTCANHHRTH
jgi:hypothetical protein